MTLASCLILTVLVWTISLIRSVRVRAFVYSLPIPMTLVLAARPTFVDGGQLLGIVALNLFFAVVAVAYHRWGWPILAADGAGIAAYVLLGTAISRTGPWPLLPTLAAVAVAWAAVNAMIARSHRGDTPAAPDRRSAWFKLVIAFGGTVLALLVGSLLHGLVVTFPYAGVLVAIESRADLPQFGRHFAYSCLGMIAFLATYASVQAYAPGIALIVAWSAFGVCGLTLALLRTVRGWPRAAPTSDGSL